MPLRVEAIESYINGKKYKSFIQNKMVNFDELKKYAQFLAPTNKPNRKYF